MPTKIEKDSITGQETTGHEWDGLKELNTPLPRWWLYVFYATVIWAAIYCIFYPALPGLNSYSSGVLGSNQRAELRAAMVAARGQQSGFYDRLAGATPAEILADPDLRAFAHQGGEAAFLDNCAPCHGAGGAGSIGGYPVLADDDWLWGGTLADIQTTITHGIRAADDEDSRASQMPAFGEVLTGDEIKALSAYVAGLGRPGHGTTGAGASLFADQCAACHGAAGAGGRAFGAPRLDDQIWLRVKDEAGIASQIRNPRHGVMPAWGGRLDPVTIKMLTVYVHGLGGGE